MINHLRFAGAALAVLCGCTGAPSNATPTLTLQLPLPDSELTPTQTLRIVGSINARNAAQVRIFFNGAVIETVEITSDSFGVEWQAPASLSEGQHILHAEAYDAQNTLLARSAFVTIRVAASAAPTTPPAPPTPTPTSAADTSPTAEPEPASPTPTLPLPTPSPQVTITAELVNLRSGPGTAYPVLGQLRAGEGLPVTGKSADGRWWQVAVNGRRGWVFSELAQPNASAEGAPIVAAPPTPTPAPIQAPATATPFALVMLEPSPTPTTPPPTPDEPPCGPDNPYWAAKLNPDAPGYTFCTPVPFEFVHTGNPDELVIRWHIYGIRALEMHIDPIGLNCGMGTTGRRIPVPFKADDFRLNRKEFPPGGYKIGLFATLEDGRIQDWGELHFCGGA